MATAPPQTTEGEETPGKHPGGRPTDCTPAIIAQAGQLAHAGNYFEAIYTYLDIPKSTAYDWRTWGAEGREPYKQFSDALEKGWAAAEVRLAAQLQQHGQEDKPGQWTALAWFLERRFSDRWGKKQDIGLHGVPGKPPVGVAVTEILANPAATEKACELEEILAASSALDPGGAGPVPE